MKIFNLKNAAFLCLIVFAAACTKEETPEVANETFVPMDTDSLIYSGSFQSSSRYNASGTVEVYDNGTSRTLAFKGFKGENGPDLKVYLSTDLSAGDFVSLGALTAVSGDFNYTLDTTVDLEKYRNVLIWCEDFSVLFGSASLE
jgi:hypothetical protein